MAGAVPNHHGIAVADGLEPEEIAADDIARLPDEEMVGGDAIELAARRQHGGLDAAGIAQALQDQLIGGGGALLAFLDVGEVAVDGDGAARLGAPLADLQPAPIGVAFQQWLAGMPMRGEALSQPAVFPAPWRLGSGRARPRSA